MRKKRSRRYFVLAVLLGIFYFFLFPYPAGKESYFKPVWARGIPGREGPSGSASADQRLSWFRSGQRFGYVRMDGSLTFVGEILHGVALSDAGFINFPKVAEIFVFLDPQGQFKYSLSGYGYPILDPSGEHLYSISTDLTVLKRLDRDGEVLWSTGFFSPITTLSLQREECVLGFLDGTLKLIDREGKIYQEFAPETSRISVILGAARSPDGGTLAVLSGIDPQRLILLERKGWIFEPEQTHNLGSDFRREVTMHFTQDGRFLAVESRAGLALLALQGGKLADLTLPGRLLGLDSSASGILAVGCRAGDGAALELLRPLSSRLYTRFVAAQELFLRFVGASLLIGFPGYLLRVDSLEG